MKKCFILIICVVASLFIKTPLQVNAANAAIHYANAESTSKIHSKADNLSKIARLDNSEERFFGGSEFREGELRTRKGLFTTEFSFRFDQLAGTIEVKKENGETMHLDEKDILYCKIFYGKTMHTFMPVALPNEKNLTLLHVIYKTPTLQLYRYIHKLVKPYHETSQFGNPASNTELTLEFRNDYRFFMRRGDKDPLQEVAVNAKSFTKVLPEKEKTITRLFRESKIKGNLTVSAICKMMGKLDKKTEAQ